MGEQGGAPRAFVFDAYGTLFDVAAAAREAAAADPDGPLTAHWPRLAEIWRDRQLQYTWLRAVTGDHADFWTVTCDGLDFALEALGLDGDVALRDRLRGLYRRLSAYPEVAQTLRALREAGMRTAILSNGSPGMLADAVTSAGLDDLLDAVISVEAVGVFKPDARVYALSERTLGVAPAQTVFVSSNGWDAACATGFGFRTLWVNRAGAPVERMPWRPDRVAPDLTAAVGMAAP